MTVQPDRLLGQFVAVFDRWLAPFAKCHQLLISIMLTAYSGFRSILSRFARQPFKTQIVRRERRPLAGNALGLSLMSGPRAVTAPHKDRWEITRTAYYRAKSLAQAVIK